MEDTARLAVIEQGVKDFNKFGIILHELLDNINHILENPHDYDSRNIKSDVVKNVLVCQEIKDYLTYIGFQWIHNEFIFPKEHTLSKLMVAKSAIERKISLCYGQYKSKPLKYSKAKQQTKKYRLTPVDILRTTNSLLITIQSLFNRVLSYEDEELQQEARDQIPMCTLELRALQKMRAQQKKIKTGETKEQDLPYDIALLMELIAWFKFEYFSWIDAPQCETCGGPTQYIHNISMRTEMETCNVEMYNCARCERYIQFPRYNNVRTLLRTRRGRCGEWANCFVMFCRALGYDTRYVYDTTDHVWCEVYDYESGNWLHVDPCEGALDTPLMYSHGWGKRLSYVIAVSCDDVQDVTWRYTEKHREVMSRRNQCSEQELISTLLTLREHRQAHVSPARRKFLVVRTLRELVQLTVERKPCDYESRGRISGSKKWRLERGEIGSQKYGHVFQFDQPGEVIVRYYCSLDEYRICDEEGETASIVGWDAGVFDCAHVFRNVEKDWRQVYISREEGETSGKISWKLSVKGDLVFTSLKVRVASAVFENGNIDWRVQFDDELPLDAEFNETPTEFGKHCKEFTITALLTGGRGDVSWQHSQLFRQSLDSKANVFEIRAHISLI